MVTWAAFMWLDHVVRELNKSESSSTNISTPPRRDRGPRPQRSSGKGPSVHRLCGFVLKQPNRWSFWSFSSCFLSLQVELVAKIAFYANSESFQPSGRSLNAMPSSKVVPLWNLWFIVFVTNLVPFYQAQVDVGNFAHHRLCVCGAVWCQRQART